MPLIDNSKNAPDSGIEVMGKFRIYAKNFGPLGEAPVQLKPLTTFVGPNNSGKSCMAQLFYTLSQVRTELIEYADYIEHPYFESKRSPGYKLMTALRTANIDALALDGRTFTALFVQSFGIPAILSGNIINGITVRDKGARICWTFYIVGNIFQ